MKFLSKALRFIKARYAPRGARQSFSQAGEDIVMSDILKKLGVGKDISYVDIGAHHPVFGNNTYLFYKRGGRGVLVEPNTALCDLIEKKRPKDTCLNAGAGGKDGEADFFVFPQSTRSTFSKGQAQEWEKTSGQKFKIEKHKIFSLDTIIDKYCVGKIPDIVSIDAEGLDAEIISGFSFAKRPKVFCVENQDKNILAIMERNGYELKAQIFQNAIFVDKSARKNS